MAWVLIGLAAASAYAQSEAQEDAAQQQRRWGIEDEERIRQWRLEDEQAERDRRSNALDAWGAYGMNGNSQGNIWGSSRGLNTGLLNPQAFRRQQGSGGVRMPWGGGRNG